jgi:hypothetical protein
MTAAQAEKPKAEEAPKGKTPTPIRQLKFDGLTVDTFVLNISGRVVLNPENADDAALINALTGGNTIHLPINGYVVTSAGKFSRDKEGVLDNVTKAASVKVRDVESGSALVLETATH